ncbi:hypothetical protein IWW34DRAFT_708086 [Fusarium oxysporum f. sp. albedinis]|nr:hypothetical protein IWW34DRAFT_708086 [Fusarium oxysporum f. sp. albedinis]KAK2470193.1 hypothetical protein H9L39_18341 [Fusarium oxysporum f. sp. albedinis]
MAEPSSTIPKASLVLVTGATGYLASQVIKQFLERGYKVRGTVRDLQKASWLVNDVFKTYADRGDLELVLVPDMATPHAFDNAVKGVSAIAHVASVVSFDPNPNNVIPQTVQGVTGILEAAQKEPSIREVVYTSSVVAATMPFPGNTTNVTRDTWNDAAVQVAWAPDGAQNPAISMMVYMASKVEAEKAMWKFVEEKKPHFTVNSVSPASIMGQPLSRSHIANGVAWVKLLYDGNVDAVKRLPAIYNIDVKDAALLHVAAILDPDTKNARLQAWADPTNWNDLLAIMRRLDPKKKYMDDLDGMQKMSLSTDFSEPLALVKKWANQNGFRTLEQTIKDNLDAVIAWDDSRS